MFRMITINFIVLVQINGQLFLGNISGNSSHTLYIHTLIGNHGNRSHPIGLNQVRNVLSRLAEIPKDLEKFTYRNIKAIAGTKKLGHRIVGYYVKLLQATHFPSLTDAVSVLSFLNGFESLKTTVLELTEKITKDMSAIIAINQKAINESNELCSRILMENLELVSKFSDKVFNLPIFANCTKKIQSLLCGTNSSLTELGNFSVSSEYYNMSSIDTPGNKISTLAPYTDSTLLDQESTTGNRIELRSLEDRINQTRQELVDMNKNLERNINKQFDSIWRPITALLAICLVMFFISIALIVL